MPLRRFIPALLAGSILWALLYGTVGFVGFELWLALYDFSPLLTLGGTAAALITIVMVVFRRRVHPEAPDADAVSAVDKRAAQ